MTSNTNSTDSARVHNTSASAPLMNTLSSEVTASSKSGERSLMRASRRLTSSEMVMVLEPARRTTPNPTTLRPLSSV